MAQKLVPREGRWQYKVDFSFLHEEPQPPLKECKRRASEELLALSKIMPELKEDLEETAAWFTRARDTAGFDRVMNRLYDISDTCGIWVEAHKAQKAAT